MPFHTQKPPSCFRQDRNSGLLAAVTAAALSLLYHFIISANVVQIPPRGTSVQTPPKSPVCAPACWATDLTCYTTLQLPHIIQDGIKQSVISHPQSGLCPATQTLPTQARTVSPNHRENENQQASTSSHQLARHALEMLGLIHCSIQMKGIPGYPSADRLKGLISQ